ncbi:MAG: hypothetical protein AAB839_01875 [Patescibacteria group bacterium]
MTHSPHDIQRLVTIAFVLEALSEKEGCTTRTVDLPGKPLEDFLIAGINVGRHFQALAEDVVREGESVEIFRHFIPALTDANRNKSPKFVNFGLLESMFTTVAARMLTTSGSTAIERMTDLTVREKPRDVHHLLDARKRAWSTSTNEDKRNYDDSSSRGIRSISDFYRQLMREFP